MGTQSFNIDLHVHSAMYSECAETLDPLKIEEYARKAELDGVVITEHNTLWNSKKLEELQKDFTTTIFNGMEVEDENGHHLIVIGVGESGPLHKGVQSMVAIEYAHAQGGVVILAHPFRNGLPPLRVIKHVDAIEIGSTSLNKKESDLAKILATELGKTAVACSDAHSLGMIGWGYTSFPEVPESSQHLSEMIKTGQCIPVLPNSFF